MALLYLLRKKIHRIPWNELGSRIKALLPLWLSLAATVCVMLLLLAHMDFWNLTDPSAIEASLRGRSMWMIVIGSIGAGSVVYLALALLLRNREIAVIRSLFR